MKHFRKMTVTLALIGTVGSIFGQAETGRRMPNALKLPSWTDALYEEIQHRLAELPLPKEK